MVLMLNSAKCYVQQIAQEGVMVPVTLPGLATSLATEQPPAGPPTVVTFFRDLYLWNRAPN